MQQSLFSMKTEKKFGGRCLAGKRKSARPLCTKRAIHLVMKISGFGLIREERMILREVDRAAKRWGVGIYRISVLGDHIHMIIKIPTRAAYRRFIQRICGIISLKLGVKWLFRPFTRIVEWGRDFKRAIGYVQMNHLESWGEIAYQPRGRKALRRRLDMAAVAT